LGADSILKRVGSPGDKLHERFTTITRLCKQTGRFSVAALGLVPLLLLLLLFWVFL
jgi:hypothetical protein